MSEGEVELVAWLRRRLHPGIGDDAAFVPKQREAAYTVDAQHEGVHFPAGLDPALLGQRLLAVNLSDLAAVGALPRFALVSLATPANWPRRRFFLSLRRHARRAGVEVVGGDLSHSDRVSAVLFAVGLRARGGRFLRRDTASVGQRVWIGGPLGWSALGCALLSRAQHGGVAPPRDLPRALVRPARQAIDRHLRPRPQLELGRWLATRRRCVPATIDVSDGLGKDLGRLARASGVGITLDAGALPLPNRGLCAWLGRDPLELTLGGGEDYVLAFTLPGGIEPPAELGCRAIGLTRKGKGVTLTGSDQPPRDVADLGFDHLADALSAQARSLRRAPP